MTLASVLEHPWFVFGAAGRLGFLQVILMTRPMIESTFLKKWFKARRPLCLSTAVAGRLIRFTCRLTNPPTSGWWQVKFESWLDRTCLNTNLNGRKSGRCVEYKSELNSIICSQTLFIRSSFTKCFWAHVVISFM